MNHQNGYSKLSRPGDHRRSLLRNQVIHLILNGSLSTTKARAEEVQRFAEKVVTVARKGNDFNTVRRINQLLPYSKEAAKKLILEIAPQYVTRPGGYTRLISLGRRPSDTAAVARLEWV